MWCVIPAAGRGTRMRGYAAAKTLVDLAGRPVIDRLLAVLPSEVTDVCVVVPPDDPAIADHLRSVVSDRHLCTVPQVQPLGVGDAVYQARARVDGPFLVVMGDAFFSESLAPFVEGWRTAGGSGAILTEPRLDSDRDEMGLLDVREGEVTRLWKGVPTDETIRVAGAFISQPSYFDAHEELARETGPEYEIEDAITRLMRAGERFNAVGYTGWRRNVNTPEDVALVARHLRRA